MRKPANFTDAEWITKASIDVMQDKVFCGFCAVRACGETTFSDALPTAATDGWNVTINPKFAASLTIEELRFVLLHEDMHKAYQHLWVYQDLWKQDPQGTNVAADMFINLALVQTDAGRGFVKVPECAIQPDDQYTNMSVQQIYEAMKQNPPPNRKKQGTGQGEGHDQHQWEQAAQPSDEEREERDEALKQAIRQGEIVRQRTNHGSGDANGVFDELLASRVDWRKLLREFITDQCQGRDDSTWRKPNRRYIAQGLYMPSMISEKMGELVIGFDTSGSCFGKATMTAFVSEVQALVEAVRPSKVHVVYWDTRVTGHQTFDDGQFAVANIKPSGGGGTIGAVLFDYLRDKRINPTAIVQLTDGEVGDWGRSEWPTLWAVTTRVRAPYGTTVQLS